VQFEGVPEEIRNVLLGVGLMDIGGEKSMMEIDDSVIDACRGSREFCAELIERARDLAQNIKDNGASFEETWAGFMALGQVVNSIKLGSYPLLAYVMTEQVFKDDEAG
jgi:hypothetical protein